MNTETNPRIAKAIGNEVLRVVSDLDLEAQIAVLRWAQAQLKRQAKAGTAPATFGNKVHPVTLGQHDAEIRRMQADGIALRNMGPYLGCSGKCVVARARVLRQQA